MKCFIGGFMPIITTQDFTEEGRLQIGTFAPDIGQPAENVLVRISYSGDDEILEEMITDASGQTPVINLPAPPIEYSMELTETRPYSDYDIRVIMDGYRPMIIQGVQILPETTAFQDIRLQPENNNSVGERIVSISDHTLWGTFPPKTPEAEVKELPPSTGYVVLPNPVIPEFIIVHDGRPNDASAPNYWVPFAEYIKNVASCEIYANWPQSTITANILAILSFTLNRVYTEWYRGQGFDFTITSSTAYDHAFSYGRNIFEEISTVVDDIFTSFITRPGIRQPLLTQYCDGKNVICPNWMTQWGSKTLGDQGYSAIDILKSFYGYDIYLMQAQRVQGVPVSFPGTPLQTGSTNEYVRIIQEQLNAISNKYPAINKVRVDGVFGPETRRAVETFQEIFRLSADGIVGFNTWYRISHIYVAVTRIAELS